MMKTWAVLFFALMLGNVAFLLAGEAMKLTENDSGKTVELSIGDEFEIVLPANPTTGYVWEANPLDSTVLKLDRTDFISNGKTIGSGGMEVIKLHPLSEGKTELIFFYHRPFEKNKPPLKTFVITINIKK